MRGATLAIVKVIAGLAAVVFLILPLSTGTQVLAFVASIVVLLICFGVSSKLDDDNTGFWPKKPEE
jgi:hypothetical protein